MIRNIILAGPPLLTFALIEWGHVTTILVFYKDGIAQLFFINIFYIFFVSSFIQIMRTNPGTVNRSPEVTYMVRYDNGEERFCDVCNVLKPDRSHHCQICKTCVLRQDHHCPWVYNCVGYYTHKLFILFTFYGFIYCTTVFISLSSNYSSISNSASINFELNVFMVTVASGLFAVALLIFSSLHISYALRNLTSMESIGFPRTRFEHRRDLNIFRLDTLENIKMYMGYDVLNWWIPTVPKFNSDGYEFELNHEAQVMLNA
eukprot:NODE_486_length_7793_cov_0.204315.p3 type:complete len:260 gc:universal NODE_486_length_7793_cov_0.204315:358-1137(+)